VYAVQLGVYDCAAYNDKKVVGNNFVRFSCAASSASHVVT
jgi:hypothetical protein